MVIYSNGHVTVKHTGLKMYFRVPYERWLAETEKSVRIRMASKEPKPSTPEERVANLWLVANDLTTATKQQAFLERFAALNGGGDDPKLVRCKKCGRVLSDPLSKALGYGPECRKK